VLAAGEPLAELAPGIRAEPRVLGSIFRSNRDTRFSRDPRPNKDHIDFWFWEGDRRFDTARLRRFRRAVADPTGGAELAGVAARLEAAGYRLGGSALKRPPPGFPSGGPAERFLLHKALFVHRDEPADDRVHTGEILEVCARHWRALAPLHRCVTDTVLDWFVRGCGRCRRRGVPAVRCLG
jgi:Conserved hypothetical protein (DUF2461)